MSLNRYRKYLEECLLEVLTSACRDFFFFFNLLNSSGSITNFIYNFEISKDSPGGEMENF